MILQQNTAGEQTLSSFSLAIKHLSLGSLLRQSNIRKASGVSVKEGFEFLLVLVFEGKNLTQYLKSKFSSLAASKNTYYRFLGDTSYNWKKLLTLLAAKVITTFTALTKPKRIKALVIDDTMFARDRSQHVEGLARVYDHTTGTYRKGFTLLTLGWTDGYSFVPVGFNLLSSANPKNRYQDMSETIDRRTHGYRRRQESLMKKTDATVKLITHALDAGIMADVVLMDSWFTTEPLLQRILALGVDVIGMVKPMKQRYRYQGKMFSLPELTRKLTKEPSRAALGSIQVTTAQGIAVKIVVIRHRRKKGQVLYLLSTNTTLSADEIIRMYGNRWSIEVCFKACKSCLKLGTEFQSRNFDALIAHTTIVFTRYILLEWMRRHEHDLKTYGELFFLCCDEVRDMDLSQALRSLMALFIQELKPMAQEITKLIRCKVGEWIESQPLFIQALFSDLEWES